MSAARMGVLAGTAALVTGGSCGIDKRIRGAPDPDGAAVVISFVCNRTAAEQVAVETTERPSADDEPWRGQGGGCRGPE
jgi:hypothetical protein